MNNPNYPARLGEYNAPGASAGIALTGGRAILAQEDGGVGIINVTNPAQMVRQGIWAAPGRAWDVAVTGTRGRSCGNGRCAGG
ncbi:MAG: hypothetical protein HZY76_21685 [Anaerolineae bacterium]|nr:MAG: hypothetical protein HZY76_21685 [Anaerolineae bacterium]